MFLNFSIEIRELAATKCSGLGGNVLEWKCLCFGGSGSARQAVFLCCGGGEPSRTLNMWQKEPPQYTMHVVAWARSLCRVTLKWALLPDLCTSQCTAVHCSSLFPVPSVSSQLHLQAAKGFHILSILQASCYLFEVSMSGRRKWPRAFPWRCCRGLANGLHRQMGFRALLSWEYIETFKEQLEVQGA